MATASHERCYFVCGVTEGSECRRPGEAGWVEEPWTGVAEDEGGAIVMSVL